jgi:hypothetical protein
MVLARRRPRLMSSSMTLRVTLERLHGSVRNIVGTTKVVMAMMAVRKQGLGSR